MHFPARKTKYFLLNGKFICSHCDIPHSDGDTFGMTHEYDSSG